MVNAARGSIAPHSSDRSRRAGPSEPKIESNQAGAQYHRGPHSGLIADIAFDLAVRVRALGKVQFDTTAGRFLDSDDQLLLFNFIAGAKDLRVVTHTLALPDFDSSRLRDNALHMIRRSVAPVILLGLGLGIAQTRVDEPPAGLTVVDSAQIRALYE